MDKIEEKKTHRLGIQIPLGNGESVNLGYEGTRTVKAKGKPARDYGEALSEEKKSQSKILEKAVGILIETTTLPLLESIHRLNKKELIEANKDNKK